LASNAFRFSIGSRRKSRPSSSSKSNAQSTAVASAVAADQFKDGKPILVKR
jgi:hypothetical protein